MSYWVEFTIRLVVYVLAYGAACVVVGVDMDSDAYKVGGAMMGVLGSLVLQCKMQLESKGRA